MKRTSIRLAWFVLLAGLVQTGCATVHEQDQQRREIIDLRWEFENTASQFAERLDALEDDHIRDATKMVEPAPPEDGR